MWSTVNSVSPLSPGGEVLTKPYWNMAFSGSSVCGVLSQSLAPSQNTHTHKSIQHTTRSLLTHMPCGPALCLLLRAFTAPRPLALCKAALGRSEFVWMSSCVGASAYVPICAEGHELMFVNRTILHLSGCVFFQSLHLHVLSLRSMCVFVCVIKRSEWGHRLSLQRLPAQGLLEYKQPL